MIFSQPISSNLAAYSHVNRELPIHWWGKWSRWRVRDKGRAGQSEFHQVQAEHCARHRSEGLNPSSWSIVLSWPSCWNMSYAGHSSAIGLVYISFNYFFRIYLILSKHFSCTGESGRQFGDPISGKNGATFVAAVKLQPINRIPLRSLLIVARVD